MFALKHTLIQQIFTGSHYGQGPGLADWWTDKEKALSPVQHGGSGAGSQLGRASLMEILSSWRQKKTEALPSYAAILSYY